MIAHIYKQNGLRIWRMKVRLDGETKLIDRSTHTSDKQVAQQKLAAFVQEKERERAGLIAPKAMRDGARKLLLDHLAGYTQELTKLGRDDGYIYNLDHLISRMTKECGWQVPADVTAESFRTWREKQQKAPKTLNEYLNSMSGFLNWLMENGKLGINPLQSVKRVDTRGKQQRKRRALTDDEQKRLLAAAGEWKPVYLTALLTGLRRNELTELLWGDVHLDAPQPFLTVQAAVSKNRREDTVWLHHDVVEALRGIRPSSVSAAESVFPQMPRTYSDHKAILKRAGIAYKDDLGRQADFHALRYTFDTNLACHGVPERVRMALMRHRTLNHTNHTYIDAKLLPTAAAIKMLNNHAETPSQIASQELVVAGPVVSCAVTKQSASNIVQLPPAQQGSHVLSFPVACSHEIEDGCLARTRT
jgi:integrase